MPDPPSVLTPNADSVKSAARHAAWRTDSDSDRWSLFNHRPSREGTMSRSTSRDTPGYDEEAAISSPKNGTRTQKDLGSPPLPESPADGDSPNDLTADDRRGTSSSRTQSVDGDANGLSRTATSLTKRNGNLHPVQEDEKVAEQNGAIRNSDDLEADRKRRHHEAMNRKIPAMQQVRTVLFPRWLTINWLLLAAPVGIALYVIKAQALAVFIVNFLAIIPLAGLLGFGTEEIAMRVGDVLGGLLNASLG